MLEQRNLIGDRWVDAGSGARMEVRDPATDEVVATVPKGGAEEARAAVDAAHAAWPQWRDRPAPERARLLRRFAALMHERIEELARTMTREGGKPLAESRIEIAYAASFLDVAADEATRSSGELVPASRTDKRILVLRQPVGVTAAITPWNFPAAMITRKLAPALGAGNAVVIKPPKETPLTALRIAELLEEAGVPKGLVNVVFTSTSGDWFEAAIEYRAVWMLSFTGSTEIGRVLLRRAVDRVLKTVMELGGNAPFVVFDDADLDLAVEGAMVAKMRHSAETCTAANRFYVEAGVVDDFSERLTAAMGAVKVGNGFEEGVTCGPLINAGAVESVNGLVKAATRAGASVALGGSRVDGPGFFYEPTVLGDVAPDSPITREEIFGPVAPVIPFTDTDATLRVS